MTVHPAKTQITLQLQAQYTQTCHDWVELRNWHDCAPSKDTDHLAIAGTGQARHFMIEQNLQIDMTVLPAKTQTILQSQAQGTQTCHDWVELTNWQDCAPSKDTDHLAVAGTGHSDMSWLSKTCKLTWLCTKQRHTPLAVAGWVHSGHVMIE